MVVVWGLEVTAERADQVRSWRSQEDGTWRVVAGLASDAWGGPGPNQLFGRDLCEAAAGRLGEDPNAPPWN